VSLSDFVVIVSLVGGWLKVENPAEKNPSDPGKKTRGCGVKWE
jgi:hypothetical protein